MGRFASPPRVNATDRGGTSLYFAAALGITWAFQGPAALATLGVLPGPVERYMPLVGFGLLGPLVAAVLASWRELGWQGVRALFRQLTWRVSAGLALVAIVLPGALLAAGMASYSLLGGAGADRWFYPPSDAQRVAAMLLIPFLEEIGWRGFALPRLQRRHGAPLGSLILGFWWTLWHIPMFGLVGIPLDALALMFPFFMGGSIVFTWLYNLPRGGLPLAVLAHAGAHLNNSHQPLPENITPLAVHTVAYCLFALVLVLGARTAWPPKRLASTWT